jgi:hypothetical protein
MKETFCIQASSRNELPKELEYTCRLDDRRIRVVLTGGREQILIFLSLRYNGSGAYIAS